MIAKYSEIEPCKPRSCRRNEKYWWLEIKSYRTRGVYLLAKVGMARVPVQVEVIERLIFDSLENLTVFIEKNIGKTKQYADSVYVSHGSVIWKSKFA